MHVTICIPTRDRGTSIACTLRSLLASSYTDWDALIIDQSCTDATARAVHALICGDPHFRYIAATTTGSSAARNLALTYAQGPLVAFTDDDCEVLPTWLECLVAYYRRNPDSGLNLWRGGSRPPRSKRRLHSNLPDHPLSADCDPQHEMA